MKKLIQFAVLAAVILCLAAAAALLVLRRMFPPARLKALALERLEASLHRRIRLKDVALGLNGLSIAGLEVSEAPDFPAGTFLRAERVRARPRLRPLLRGRIEVADILLSGWECRLIRRKNGAWNFSSPDPADPPSAAPSSAAAALPPAWAIGRLRAENGTLRYLDEASGAAWTLGGIEATARNIRPRGPVEIELSLDYSGPGLKGRVELRGKVDLADMEPSGMSLRWSSLKLRHQGLAMESSGEIEDLAAPAVKLRVSIPKQRLSPADASRWPGALTGLLPLDARIAARKNGGAISLQAHGSLGRGAFQASLEARGWGKAPEVRLEGELSELDLSGMGKAPAAPAGDEKGALKPSGASAQAASPGVHSSGRLSVGKIVLPNFTASKSVLNWDLKDANVASRIAGSAKLDIGPGRFDDLGSIAGRSGLLQAVLLPVTLLQKAGKLARIPLFPAFDRVNFKTITGDYAFQNGVMTIRESHLDSDAAYVTAKGRADLGRETLDMRLSTRLLARGLSGPIGFKVGGTFSNPSVKPDVASILKQPAVNDAIQRGTKLLQNLFK